MRRGTRPLETAKQLGLDAVGLPISSDPIESLFGLTKQHGVGPVKDANRIALRMPAFCGLPQQEARQVLEVTVAQQHALSDGFSSLTKQRRQMRANPHHLEQLGHGQQQGNVELIPPGEERSDRSDIIYLTGNGGGPPGPKSGQGLDATLDGLGLLEPFGIRRYYTDYWGAYRRHLDADKHQPGKRQTQQAERKHLTLRTRIQRLTRRTICFSKSIQMHDIVIGLFVNRYEFGLLI